MCGGVRASEKTARQRGGGRAVRVQQWAVEGEGVRGRACPRKEAALRHATCLARVRVRVGVGVRVRVRVRVSRTARAEPRRQRLGLGSDLGIG